MKTKKLDFDIVDIKENKGFWHHLFGTDGYIILLRSPRTGKIFERDMSIEQFYNPTFKVGNVMRCTMYSLDNKTYFFTHEEAISAINY